MSNSNGKGNDRPLTSEEVIALSISRGLTIADLDKMTYGMLINYSCAYERQEKIRVGKKVIDPEDMFNDLKANQPTVEKRYRDGKISKEKYERYMNKIKRWEEYDNG